MTTKTKQHTLITERFIGHKAAHATCRACGWRGPDGLPKPPICPNDPDLDAAGEIALLNSAMATPAWRIKMGNGASDLIDAFDSTLDILARDTLPFAQAVQDAGFIHTARARRDQAELLEELAASLDADPTQDATALMRQIAATLRTTEDTRA